MAVKSKLKGVISVPLDFFKIFFINLTHHKGKLSKFKIMILLCALGYMFVQPWLVVRAALASSFTGYMFNNITDNVLNTVVQIET